MLCQLLKDVKLNNKMWTCLYQSKLIRTTFLSKLRKQFSSSYSVFNPQPMLAKNNYSKSQLSSLLLNQKRPKIILRHAITKVNKPAPNELWRLLLIARSERWKLSGAILLLFVSSSVTMAVPYCVGKIIDLLTSSNADLKENLVLLSYILIAVFTIGAAANFGRVYLMNICSHRVVNSLRKKTYASLLQQETGFFDRSNTGELINRLSADTATVGMSVTNNISDGLRSMFAFIAGSSLMVYTSPHLAFLGLVTVAPVAIIATVSGRILKRNSQCVQDALANATQVAEERLSNIRTVQAFAKSEEENKLYGSKIDFVLHYATKGSLGRAVFFGMA